MKNKIDMVNGNLAKNIIVFTIPIVFTSLIQLLFNTFDMIIVGKFAGNNALAAVGATGALYYLIISLFMGVSVGVNVVAAQFFGKKDETGIRETIHTSVSLGGILGIILTFLGIILVTPCLKLMNTPAEIIDLSVLYMKIYFSGMPGMLLYNCGASILRADGNTKSPLIYLTIGGVVNIILNLILVIVFKLSVAGVAIATVASFYISCLLVIIHLKKNYGLNFKALKIKKSIAKEVFRIGLPSGFSSLAFSISSMQLQTALNSFGAAAVAGCSAASSIEGLVNILLTSIAQAATNFAGQNYGAGKKERIPKVYRWSMLYVIISGTVSAVTVLTFDEQLLSLYVSGEEAIRFGAQRLAVFVIPFMLSGALDIPASIVRGMGYSMVPTAITLVSICGIRVLWIATIFKMFPTIIGLYICVPLTWGITFIAQQIYYNIIMKRENIK